MAKTNNLQRGAALERRIKQLTKERDKALEDPEAFVRKHYQLRLGRSKRDAGPEARELANVPNDDPDLVAVLKTGGAGGASRQTTEQGEDSTYVIVSSAADE